MKFTLCTYDCMLAHNAEHKHSVYAVKFIETLSGLVDDFAKHSGVEKSNIYWEEVQNSDWCKGMLILSAKVAPDWTPTAETIILDESYHPKYFPNLAKSLYIWIRGECLNINEQPAETPHQLFRSKVRA